MEARILNQLSQFQCRNIGSTNYLHREDHYSMNFVSFIPCRKPFENYFLNFVTSVKRFTFSIILSFIAMHELRGEVSIIFIKIKQPG